MQGIVRAHKGVGVMDAMILRVIFVVALAFFAGLIAGAGWDE